MTHFPTARIIDRNNKVDCQFYGNLDFNDPSFEARIKRDLVMYQKEEPDRGWRIERSGETGVWRTQEVKKLTICRYCGREIEPCLERRTGWKHVQPWMAEDLRCGGKAQPP